MDSLFYYLFSLKIILCEKERGGESKMKKWREMRVNIILSYVSARTLPSSFSLSPLRRSLSPSLSTLHLWFGFGRGSFSRVL